MNNAVKEILEYLKTTTKENTTKEQFQKDMDKYDLEDILEAFDLKKREIISFEDDNAIYYIMAKDERFIIAVRPYTIQERDQEIEKYSNGLNELLDEEYRCDDRGYETFDEFYEDCLEVEEFEQQYKYDNGDCPEAIDEDTFCYTLIDLKENIRSSDNYYCKFDYDKQEECDKALIELNNGDMQLSRRNKVELKIKEIK